MCGIVGIASRGRLSDADRAFLNSAAPLLAHRGPDGQGMWNGEHAGFAHRRLSIIDLAGGAQPMHDATGRYTITFNGEIYNYKELRALLQSKGYVFHTASDTEVILNAYAHWDTACVEHFNGIFAFGLWDAPRQRLFLARDHLGVKPLLYHADAEHVIFASEVSAVLSHPSVQPEIDVFALSDYLSLGYVLAPKTIIRDVRKLPAATRLVWEGGQLRLERYWDLAGVTNPAARPFTSEEQAVVELQDQLERAVRLQLVSDVPVGAFLSGGIDSSTIVQKMVALAAGPVQTFSIGFNEESYSELPYARLAADHLGTEHHEQIVTPDIDAVLPQLARYFDEPFSDTSAVPTYALCQWTRNHVKVALSGDGGDECFAGYETYRADKLQALYSRVPALIHRALVAPLVARLPATYRKVGWDYKLKHFVAHARCTPEEAHYSWRLMLTEDEKRRLLSADVQRVLGDYTPFDVFSDYYREVPRAAPLNRSLYVDTKTWLVDAMLVKVDRASMAHGLEVRVPLLDYKLVEFAMSLPPHFKLRGLQTKAILKRAMARSLPSTIVRRPKRGFNAPVAHWVERILKRAPLQRCGLMPGLDDVQGQLLHEHTLGHADNGFKLWTLIMWSLWQQAVLQSERRDVSAA